MSEQRPPAQKKQQAPARSGGIPAGRIFGVPLVVSPLWVFLVVAVTTYGAGVIKDNIAISAGGSFLVALAVVLLMYVSVLLHETGHVLVAKALGLRVGRVVLQLFGASSEILDEPQTPGREYLVAAVGPLTSVLLAGIAAAFIPAFPDRSVGWLLASSTATINGLVAAFNLLPGLPLDGGRLLRAAVWHYTKDKLRAQEIAGRVGQGIAGAVLLFALVEPSLIHSDDLITVAYLGAVAAILYMNATASINSARNHTIVPQVELSRLLRPALTVEPQMPLAEAVRRAREAGARALVVVDSRDRWSGIVSEAAVQSTPPERQPWISVSDLARPVEAGLVLSPGLNGDALMSAVDRTPASEYLVAGDDGALRGVLARADLLDALRALGAR